MDFYSVGEMVIDFLPGEEPGSYIRNAGGAPANVAIAVARNGLDAGICCKVGDDDFGRFLIRTLAENGVKAMCPTSTKDATTTMAFVTLQEDGERSFTFARKPGADMLLRPEEIREEDIAASKIIHGGSCSLSKEPVASATVKALRLGHEMKKLVSFDVNYRNLMWADDIEAATAKVAEILPYVDFLKISEEETGMVGGAENLHTTMEHNGISVLVETLGSAGARCFWRGKSFVVPGEAVEAVDATGAGDAFWGAFLSHLVLMDRTDPAQLTEAILREAIQMGNISGSLSVRKKGAISSLPTRAEIEAHRKGGKRV